MSCRNLDDASIIDSLYPLAFISNHSSENYMSRLEGVLDGYYMSAKLRLGWYMLKVEDDV